MHSSEPSHLHGVPAEKPFSYDHGQSSVESFDDESSFRDVIRVLRRRRFSLFVFTGIGLALALMVCFLMQPQFLSTVTILVGKESSDGLDLGSLSGLSSLAGGADDVKTDLATRAAVIESDTTILSVRKALSLGDKKPFAYKASIWGSSPAIQAERKLPIDKAPLIREHFLSVFRKELSVKLVPDTRLIQISIQNPDPTEASDIANAMAANYIQNYLETRFEVTRQASTWLAGQLADLKERVKESQDKLSDYEHRTGLNTLVLGSSKGDSGGLGVADASQIPAIQKLSTLNQAVTAAEANRIAKEAIYQMTQTESPDVVLGLQGSPLISVGGGTSVTSSGGGLAVLQGLRQQEAALKVTYADADTKYGANNPRLIEISNQIVALDQQIHLELLRANQRAKNDFLLAKKSEIAITDLFNQQKAAVSKVNDDEMQLQIYAAEALSSRELYEELYTKLQEAGITEGVHAANVSVVDTARPPAHSTKPNWQLYPLVGIASGFVIGLGFVFILEALTDSISTPEDVERTSGYPVLGIIPKLSKLFREASSQDSSHGTETSPLISHPRSPEAEKYRTLRTAILLSSTSGPIKTLLVTSALGAEGKSTTAYNLAISFAESGQRVLIIDADLRKPTIHHLMRGTKTPGLANVLSTDTDPEEVVQAHSTLKNLFFMPAGPSPPMPAEMLSSGRFSDVLNAMQKRFDIIILDSPPSLLVTDAVLLSTKVSGTLMVVRSGQTTQTVVRRMSEALSKSSGRKIGFILNDVDTQSADYYYSYGYYGGDKYYGESV